MKQREYASGGKLPFHIVEQLREVTNADKDTFAYYGERHGVHLETVRRAYKGLTWKRPMRKKKENESRQCFACYNVFERRRNGRLLSATLWDKKKTCSPRCLAAYRRWLRDSEHKPEPTGVGAVQPADSADGHLRQDGASRLGS